MKTVALGDIAAFIRGVTFKPSDVMADGVGVMRTKNVQQTLALDDIMRIPPQLVKQKHQYLREGDTLVSSANSWAAVGKACWIPKMTEPFAIGGFVSALRATSADADPRYLYRWFTAPDSQTALRSFSNQTTNISNLNLRRAAQMSVPLPPLAEQRRIAAILDHADALRAKRREVLAHLDSLTQSIFHDMFGSENWNSTLGQLADVQIGPFGSLLHQGDYVSGGVAVINPMHIRGGAIHPDMEFSVSEAKASALSRYRLRRGDVVLGRRGEMGRAGVASNDHSGMICGTGSVILRPAGIESRFLHAVLTSARMKGHLERSSLGATLPNLNAGIVKSSPAPTAPIHIQSKLAERLAKVEQGIAVERRANDASDEIFASLQARAFRGEL